MKWNHFNISISFSDNPAFLATLVAPLLHDLNHSPTLVVFENGIPNLYDGSLGDETTVLDWLILQRNSASIEDVTDELLRSIIEEEEYVAVFFR